MRTAVQQICAALVMPHALPHQSINGIHQQRRAIGHGRIDHLPLARLASFIQSCHHAKGQHHAAATKVANEIQGRCRLPAGLSDAMQHARKRDVVDVMTRSVSHGSVLAPTGHAPVNQCRISGQTHIGPQPQALGYARAKSLEQNICTLHQFQNGLNASLALQVYRNTLTATSQHIVFVCVLALGCGTIHTNQFCPHIR